LAISAGKSAWLPSLFTAIGDGTMELIKNLKRTIEDANEKIKQVEGVTDNLLKQKLEATGEIKRLQQRNMELQTALCRCRDMIEDLKNAGSPNELEHDAVIYLNILEGLITEKIIMPYQESPHVEYWREVYTKRYAKQKELEEGK
jgi:DNA repair protein RadC